MSTPVCMALFGCGAAGKLHAGAIARSGCTTLKVVVDPNEEAASRLGKMAGVKWTTDVDSVLGDSQVEAVSIAVPHDEHFALGRSSIEANKHVLLEKPFTLNVEEGSLLARRARDLRLVIAPWLERRYAPHASRAREMVQSGALGNIVYVRISTLGYKPRAYWAHGMNLDELPSTWRRSKRSSGGGVMLMNSIHQIDLMHYLTGLRPVSVFAFAAARSGHDIEVEDIAIAGFQYDTGAFGSVEASSCTFGVGRFPIDVPEDAIFGTDGHLRLGTRLRFVTRDQGAGETQAVNHSISVMKQELLAEFFTAVRSGSPMRASVDDALLCLSMVQSAYRSAEMGRLESVAVPSIR